MRAIVTSLIGLGLAVVLAALYRHYRRKDSRLLRNGLLLVGAGWFGLTSLLGLLTVWVPSLSWVTVVLLLLTPLGVLVLAVFLLGNGVRMLRSEGRSLANLLSLLAGLALVALPVAVVALLQAQRPATSTVALLLVFLSGYFGAAFVTFLVYSVVYGRAQRRGHPAALVILGSKVIDGRVPPLLRSRLDKALELYRQARAAGGPAPLLIPSGGRGEDEVRSEGAAMADYLLDHGADPDDVRPETAARNTRENLLYASQVQHSAGRDGPVLAVTNNYHVLRAAVLARQIGDAQVVGAPTALYYVPSAFLREFIAILVEHKRLHLAVVVPVTALTLLLIVAVNLSWIT